MGAIHPVHTQNLPKKLPFPPDILTYICGVRIRGYEMLVFDKFYVRTKWMTRCENNTSRCSQVFYRIAILKIFAKFTGKQLNGAF